MIFRDATKRAELDRIMHPIILERMKEEIAAYEEQGKTIVILDVPLLLELGWQDKVSVVWLVAVSPDTQKRRLMARNNLTEEQAMVRIASQMSIEEKRRYADVIINNDGTLEETEQTVRTNWTETKRMLNEE